MANDAMPMFPAGGFELISAGGASFTIPVKGQKLILPTKNLDVLPFHNEYAVNSGRCTIAETPWGGMKGTAVPSFTVGSIYCPTAGCYLQDKNGANTSKYLTAGKLVETSSLTVDTTAKTITEEFIVENTGDGGTSVQIDSLTTGWIEGYSSGGTVSYSGGVATVTNAVADSAGRAVLIKAFTAGFLTGYNFVKFTVRSSLNGYVKCVIANTTASTYKTWDTARFPIVANTWTTFVLPILAPVGNSGQNPSGLQENGGTFAIADMNKLYIGVSGLGSGATVNVDFKDVYKQTGKPCYVEIQTPDNLADNSLQIQAWDSTLGTPAYATFGTYKLDPVYAYVSGIASNCKYLDGTKTDDCVTVPRALYPKKSGGMEVTGSDTVKINYSSNKGTLKRIGIRITLPPSDSGRTNFNKIKLKLIIYYSATGSTAYEFSNDTSQSTGLKNLSNPWMGLLDSSGNVGYLVFTERPNSLTFMRDDSGDIYEVTVDPGNAMVYRGSTYLGNQTVDANSNGIPNVLEEAIEGSIANLLKYNRYNYEQQIQYDLSTSAIQTNDFSITANSLDIIPFGTSSDDSVYTTTGTKLVPTETVATQTGNIAIYDVRDKTAIRVRDTPGIFSGDCKVWDTAGQAQESNWKRVYDPNWVFTGDRVVENGLIRYKDVGLSSGLLFIRYNNAWVYFTPTSYATNSIYPLNETGATTVTSISADEVKFTRTITVGTFIGKTYNFIIRRGSYGIKIEPTNGDTPLSYYPKGRFFLNGAVLYDSEFYKDNSLITLSSIEQYNICFSPTSNWIILASTAFRQALNGTIKCKSPDTTGWMYLVISGTTNKPVYIYTIPYDCSKLYYEAEANTDTRLKRAGTVFYTGVDANPATGNTGFSLQNQYSWVGYTFKSDLPAGIYRVYFRCKTVGNATSADSRIYKKDTVTSTITNLTPALPVNPGSNFAYVSVDYTHDPTGHDFLIYIHKNGASSDVNYTVIDYILIVPTGLIEKHAKRSLWNPSPLTTTVVDIPR